MPDVEVGLDPDRCLTLSEIRVGHSGKDDLVGLAIAVERGRGGDVEERLPHGEGLDEAFGLQIDTVARVFNSEVMEKGGIAVVELRQGKGKGMVIIGLVPGDGILLAILYLRPLRGTACPAGNTNEELLKQL